MCGSMRVVALFVLMAGFASAQYAVRHTLANGSLDECGSALCRVGDVNGDGYDDVAMGCPKSSFNRGAVATYSGLDGTLIWWHAGPAILARFGETLTALPDVNNDGVKDIAVGSPEDFTNGADAGAAHIISGSSGAVIHSFFGTAGSEYGRSLACVEIPGGNPRLIIGKPQRNGAAGGFDVCDAVAGSVLFPFNAINAGDQVGHSIAATGDIDGDGWKDFVVGSPGTPTPAGGVGSVSAYSFNPAAPGYFLVALIFTVDAGNALSYLGWSVDGAGDVNGDGLADVIAGAPEYDNATGTDRGRAQVFTGPHGALMFTKTGAAQMRLGRRVVGLGDVNGDGLDDFGASAPHDNILAENVGDAFFWRGGDGSVLGSIGGSAGTGFGNTLATGGDLDGDGIPEVLIGDGVTGRAIVVALEPALPGSHEDLVLRTGIAGNTSTLPDVKDLDPVTQGMPFTIELDSPGGTYESTFPAIVAWVHASPAPPVALANLPEVHVDPFSMVILSDIVGPAPFGAALLQPGGLTLNMALPFGMAGNDIVVQGVCLAASPRQNNPSFTTTNAHILRFF